MFRVTFEANNLTKRLLGIEKLIGRRAEMMISNLVFSIFVDRRQKEGATARDALGDAGPRKTTWHVAHVG